MRNLSFNKIKYLLGLMLLAPEVNAFVSTTKAKSSIRRINGSSSSQLQAITKDVVYDGPEWTSLQDCLGGGAKTSSSCGKMTVVVGSLEGEADSTKIVGIAADSSMLNGEGQPTTTPIQGGNNNLQVYTDSIAKLPSNIKDQDAINTVIAALTGVECCLPKVEGVGGSDDNSIVSGKVVVLGGSDYACFAAEGLATMGSKVYLVSTNNMNLNHNNVEVLPPAVGDDEVGFATHIGEFDSLLDTADDERPSMRFSNNDDDDDDDGDGGMMSRGTTLRLLQQRHKCERYVSSMTRAQDIVNGEGVFFGPGKVKDHVKQIQQQLDSKPHTFQSIVPPSSFGKTVETLLAKGVVYKNSKDFVTSGNTIVRGWSLKDFMETTTWPSDSSGGGSRMVRYGLPVLEEEEEEEEEFQLTMLNPEFIDREAWDEDIRKEEEEEAKKDQQNPFVKQVVGEQGMYDTIVREQRDCVLFLSAKFCRTCKTLNPRYTTLARQTMEANEDILFAKAEAAGDVGKGLSKLLNVDSVPAFVLFRKGRRFGPNLSISKMPSKKLAAAIDLLESGMDWDPQAIQEAAGGETSR